MKNDLIINSDNDLRAKPFQTTNLSRIYIVEINHLFSLHNGCDENEI